MKIWRPFTQEQITEKAIKAVKADGLYIYTEDGRKFADMISSWWVNIHGHSNKEIAKAIADQAATLEHVIFTAFTHHPAEELVQKLKTVLPKTLSKFFFSDNGSTAVEVALKIAYQFFRNNGDYNRDLFMHLDGSYHGDTFGAMSVSGKHSKYHFNFSDLFFNTIAIPVPEFYEGVENIEAKEDEIIANLEIKLSEIGDNVCALIVEPLIQGACGMVVHRHEFLDRLVRLVKKFGILVIFDEVMTGFYRTGRFFAMDYCSEKPDIICISKALTGGFLPLSITVTTEEIYSAFLSDEFSKAFIHGHSYTGNSISCAAACKSFEILMRENTIKQIDEISKFMQSLKINGVKKRRTLGCMTAFDLESVELAKVLAHKLFDSGFLIRPLGKTIYLLPPYCTKVSELEECFNLIRTNI